VPVRLLSRPRPQRWTDRLNLSPQLLAKTKTKEPDVALGILGLHSEMGTKVDREAVAYVFFTTSNTPWHFTLADRDLP
jgi:hypothetical protein